ncbi:Putative aspartic peptidase A1 family, aspartic peptidase domain superfamily [Septoria linicola]|uniref:Aspartic peptidase A1 family, aspartic peptidase domain superfamily n=1 Tax=Septoria linicola TaxID=215465 RepID=A0A9Q9AQ90_9PEZI|nr:Putative aspartic peptidase A1 family, aspartic peptidase domain superfamily [Septoria linicola]
MHYTFVSAAVAASAGLALAAPAGPPTNQHFQITQVPRGQVFKSGPYQMLKTYGKYAKVGAVAPARVQEAAAAVQSGSVSANPQQFDQAYLSPVTVGGKTLELDFDTGSADLWVFSTLMPSSEQSGHVVYNPSTSGRKLQGSTWNISYGDGSGASGTVYADKVVVGSVTATSQAVEAATSVSAQFAQDEDNDGLLGLAFSTINTVKPTQQTTFFDTVKSSLAKKLFAVDLKAGRPGTYDFGYIDSSKYTGSIAYTAVDQSNGFWQFNSGGFSVGSGNATSGSIGSSIMDTGTSLLYLPSNVASSYYSKVSGAKLDNSQGGYTFPCRNTLPNFNVAIGGKTFTVPGSYIKYAPIDNSGTTCFGGIQSNTGIGFTIFGDVFMKAVYVVFDQTTSSPRLGIAAQS